MHPTPTTSAHGAAPCAEPDAAEGAGGEMPAKATEVEARRRWLATAAWPEVAFANA